MTVEMEVGLGARLRAAVLLQESDSLEELEAEGLSQEGPLQISARSPILGGHRFSTPSRPLTVATILENELTVQ
jgi:hypothetical protein